MIKIKKRFLAKVVKKNTSCWRWLGAKDKDGYGYFFFDGIKGGKAHRFSWMFFNKKQIPKGSYVLHKCNNPSCVNPKHLYLGTPLQNMRDREKAGNYLMVRGENSHFAKLTKSIILQIRKLKNEGLTQKKLASLFHTTQQNIYLIVKRKNWKHI